MRIPITRYGLPQIILLPIAILAVSFLSLFFWPEGGPWVQIAAVVVVGVVLAFFRDPDREVPDESNVLIAPADGVVTDICQMEEPEFIQGPALRIGIFLSVLDVHINRSPLSGSVGFIKFHPGKCINAMRWKAASEQNQANSMGIESPDHPAGKVLIKQITGAIARRIVCDCSVGDELAMGQRYGMIKFGSRTELFLPIDDRAKILVEKGGKVRAGRTIMVRYHNS